MNRNAFLDELRDLGEVVIKPTVESGSGRGVRFARFKDGVDVYNGDTVNEVIDTYGGSDIAIQECVRPAECLRNIYPYAVNTFRIMTYILDGHVYNCPAFMRIGRDGRRLDNAHAGGMFIGIDQDVYLREYAYTEQGERFGRHPDTGVIFKGYRIENVPLLIDACKRMHAITPQLGIISWDVTLNDNNGVELLEINTRGGAAWAPQMANGEPLFGDNTERLLSLIR